jgi:agmatinase
MRLPALTAACVVVALAVGVVAQETAPWRRAGVTRVPPATTMYGVPSAPDLTQLDADVVFLGVPYDLGHGSVPGTRLGPAAIRDASTVGGPGASEGGFYDRETAGVILKGVKMVDAGNVVIPVANVEASLSNVTAAVAAIVARHAMPVVIGGDHSITYAVLRGFRDAGQKIHIIHLDSHQDFGPMSDASGPFYGHGNHLRHAKALPWIGGITMMVLRGLARGAGGTGTEIRSLGIETLSASEIIRIGPAAAVARIPAAEAYYVTLDIDVVDPSLAPATGTPVPGGFTYYQICDLLAAIAGKGRIAGFDIMEVSPPNDVKNQTSLMAAYIGLRFLGSVFEHHPPAARAAPAPRK